MALPGTLTVTSLSFCLLLMIFFSPYTVKTGPVFDRYATVIGIKAENERLNNYAIQLRNAPGSRGIIAVYAKDERTVKSVQARARRAFNYLIRKHGINPRRISWRYEAVSGQYDQVVLYHLYPKENDPQPDSKCLRP